MRLSRSFKLIILPSLAAALFLTDLRAGEDKNQAERRIEYAKTIEVYDFEPRGNKVGSRDIDHDGKPDYWEAVRGEQYRPYLAKDINIVRDPKRERYGLWRNTKGKGMVLEIPYDGNTVAMQTRIPKTIDPDLAYEVTAYACMEFADEEAGKRREPPTGDPNTFVRIKLVWLNGDNERVIGQPDIINIDTGQRDWPESVSRGTPWNLLINDLPTDSKTGLRPDRVRVILEVTDNPAIPGADRHVKVWFDDIRIKSRPKIRVMPVFRDKTNLGRNRAQAPLVMDIRYLGLVENIPDPERNGSFKGKNYRRSIIFTDINGDPPLDSSGNAIIFPDITVDPGPKRSLEEKLTLNIDRLGIYYATITLKGHKGATEAEVTQVLGLSQPPKVRNILEQATAGSTAVFDINLGSPPAKILQSGTISLADVIQRAGVIQIKADIWPDDFKPHETSQPYMANLSREFRRIRANGVRIAGIIPDNTVSFRNLGIAIAMKENLKELETYLDGAMPFVRAHIEEWQWGTDNDKSFTEGISGDWLIEADKSLSNRAAAIVQVIPIDAANPAARMPTLEQTKAVSLLIPKTMSTESMVNVLANLARDKFVEFRRPGRNVYPPQSIGQYIPREAASEYADRAGFDRQKIWVRLELRDVPRHERNAEAERRQMEEMAYKAIVARAVGVDRITLGNLYGTGTGLCAVDSANRLVPRPALLAARTLEDHLGGAEFIGSFQLGDSFPNYVFRTGNKDNRGVAIALWYNGPRTAEYIDRLQLGNMPLLLIDMAGNSRELESNERNVLIRKTPMLITGMDPMLALTRMSIRILPTPPLKAMNEFQTQIMAITNYFSDQLPVTLDTTYATDRDFVLEKGWTKPGRKKLDLARSTKDALSSDSVRYDIQPDPKSVMGAITRKAAMEASKKKKVWPMENYDIGEKYAQIITDISSASEVKFKLLRKTYLTSDLDVELHYKGINRGTMTLEFRVRWFPESQRLLRNEIQLRPYYKKSGSFPQERPLMTIPVYDRMVERPAVTVKLNIPTRPVTQTWVGLQEVGGTRFYIIDITELLRAAEE